MNSLKRPAGLTTILAYEVYLDAIDIELEDPAERALEALESEIVWTQLMEYNQVVDQVIGSWQADCEAERMRIVKGVQSMAGYRVSMSTIHKIVGILHSDEGVFYCMKTDVGLFGLTTETEIAVFPSDCKKKCRLQVSVKGSSMIHGQVVNQSKKAYLNLPEWLETHHQIKCVTGK
ncbi:hypothetical protein HDU78_001773 [Chytriomyces hyalinus]|uniref:Uncharacterized protein n=1 Tax=Chytriomyces confervae TaxID=246404 RepID=A0A507FIV6_9FUNG|nr:hypothetical protein HDU78_001773 [Chytriomyces hyalinus]KAJ3266893.1 hypothetical protein HDU77_009353 [Chytriomyces hyalinus]KAJ3405507.1 hypothetical protein HDU80_001239 [Chytriomyces hyalinus]TPX75640.1 hypothetical protein CcCBS67573_g03088 [Chytriomyces confervae]